MGEQRGREKKGGRGVHGPLMQLQSILNSFILFYPHSSVLKVGLELLIPPTELITE